MTVFRHLVCFIGDSHAKRLSRLPRSMGVTCGRLFVGFETNANCARKGLGADMTADSLWLRSQLCKLATDRPHPAFAVLSLGGNALVGRPEPGQQFSLTENPDAAVAECLEELRKIFDQIQVLGDVRVLILSVVPRLGLDEKALAKFRELSSKYHDLAKRYGHWYLDVEDFLNAASDFSSGPGDAPRREDGTVSKETSELSESEMHVDSNHNKDKDQNLNTVQATMSPALTPTLKKWWMSDNVHLNDNANNKIWEEFTRLSISAYKLTS